MCPVDSFLDEALDLGRMELSMLTDGNIEQAEALANDRGRLLDMAWRGRGRISQDQFLDKMEQMKTMHSLANMEAMRLHKLLKDDLLRIRKQGKRLSGYRDGASPSLEDARFLKKTG
jgi:hypothetical protein